ncbi:MAG TPA: 5-oxoprolinase subunit PxpA [Rectinemataceae bacterium]|nr:5-oxoprolinase subunit PxpA [Rectinemataceae bacterium]
MTIDLNADVGESFGAYSMGNDAALLGLVSSANIACGAHAGDPSVMRRTIADAIACGASLGAHPGYPDLQGFGRRSMAMSESEVYGWVLYQIGALQTFARAAGSSLRHVKPHGALYNDAAKNLALARGIARAVHAAGGDLCLVGLPDCEMERAAKAAGIAYAREFFADRAYEDDGSLVPRSREGAVLHDEDLCVRRVLRLVAEGRVETASGKIIPISAETICLHGDNEKAVVFARLLTRALKDKGVEIRPFAPAVLG